MPNDLGAAQVASHPPVNALAKLQESRIDFVEEVLAEHVDLPTAHVPH